MADAIRGSREKDIFVRDEKGQTQVGDAPQSFFADDAEMQHTLSVLSQLPIRPTQLFLSRANSLPEEQLRTTLRGVIEWLTEDLIILEAEARSCDMLEGSIPMRPSRSLRRRFCATSTREFVN